MRTCRSFNPITALSRKPIPEHRVDDLKTLLERALRGDLEAFGEVVSRFQGSVISLAYAKLGNWHDAEDAAQEAFITAYRTLKDLRDLECFPGWLRRVALTACNRSVRRAKLPTTRFDEADNGLFFAGDPASDGERTELRDAILSALRSLSPAYRDCMRLHYLEGYSIKEVAMFLGVPQGTVKRRLHDSRKHLQRHMIHYAPRARRTKMTKELDGLTWQCGWTSHMACIKGCLNYLHDHGSREAGISRAWLFGGTGHAFIINIHDVICASGPTAFHSEMFFRLATNFGCRITGIFGHKSEPDFAAKQEAAWVYVRGCLDKDIPCYGWELGIPEFYTIHGYDDVGYYYRGPVCDEGAGPKPWKEVGGSEIGVLEMYSVKTCSPAPDEETVKEAFTFALEFAESPRKWVFPRYQAGPKAFEKWAKALEQGTAERFGHGYNAEVWSECRGEAVGFLKEAKERLPGKADALFDEAIEHYSVVHAKVRAVRDLHPFQGTDVSAKKNVKSPESAALLREAGAAEGKGMETLQKIVEAL